MSLIFNTPPTNRNRTAGFTLLEVLVALVIFSVGLLGLAGIQGVSLRNNNLAYMRTVAMQSAYDMSDILRASAGFDNSIDPAYDAVDTNIPGAEPATNCTTSDCTQAQMAAHELYYWKHYLDERLPCGRGAVQRNGEIYTITILWDEDRNVDPANCDAQIADLKTFTLNLRI